MLAAAGLRAGWPLPDRLRAAVGAVPADADAAEPNALPPRCWPGPSRRAASRCSSPTDRTPNRSFGAPPMRTMSRARSPSPIGRGAARRAQRHPGPGPAHAGRDRIVATAPVVRSDEHELPLLLGAAPELVAGLVERRLAPLEGLPEARRAQVIETLGAWLAEPHRPRRSPIASASTSARSATGSRACASCSATTSTTRRPASSSSSRSWAAANASWTSAPACVRRTTDRPAEPEERAQAEARACRSMRARAAATSDAITGESGSASGCHCTPGSRSRPEPRSASTRPSAPCRPVTTKPSPTASTAWWWCERVLGCSPPAASSAREPGSTLTGCALWRRACPARAGAPRCPRAGPAGAGAACRPRRR